MSTKCASLTLAMTLSTPTDWAYEHRIVLISSTPVRATKASVLSMPASSRTEGWVPSSQMTSSCGSMSLISSQMRRLLSMRVTSMPAETSSRVR